MATPQEIVSGVFQKSEYALALALLVPVSAQAATIIIDGDTIESRRADPDRPDRHAGDIRAAL